MNGIMRIARYRNLIVTLLMVIFIGQTVASTNVSCESLPSPHQSHEEMMAPAKIGQSQHAGLHSASADGVSASECYLDCDCSLGGCGTAVLPGTQPAFTSDLASLTSHYNELAENQLAVSLFRPPISR